MTPKRAKPMRKIRNPAVRIQADKSVLVITVSHTAPATMVSRPPRHIKTGPYVLFPLPHSVRIARMKSMPATISNNMQNKLGINSVLLKLLKFVCKILPPAISAEASNKSARAYRNSRARRILVSGHEEHEEQIRRTTSVHRSMRRNIVVKLSVPKISDASSARAAANVKRAAPRVPRPPGEESQRTKASSSSVMETTVTAPRRGLSCKTASTMRTSTHAKNMMPPQTVKRRHLLLYASIRSTSITRT